MHHLKVALKFENKRLEFASVFLSPKIPVLYDSFILVPD